MSEPTPDQIAAALDRLASTSLADLDPAAAAVVLERIGDAVRLHVAIPAQVSTWLDGLAVARLDELVAIAVGDLSSAASSSGEVGGLEATALARDRAESARVAALRWCAARDVAPVSLAALDALEAAVGALDRALAAGHDGDRSATAGPVRHIAELAPPSSVVGAYVAEGRAAQWVEGAAAADAGFRDQLRETIDAFDAVGEPCSPAARRWRSAGRPAARSPDLRPSAAFLRLFSVLHDSSHGVEAAYQRICPAAGDRGAARAAATRVDGTVGERRAVGVLNFGADEITCDTLFTLSIEPSPEPSERGAVRLLFADKLLAVGAFDRFGQAQLRVVPEVAAVLGSGVGTLAPAELAAFRFEILRSDE